MSSIRPKYGEEEEDIIDIEPEDSEHNEAGDWNDILKEQQKTEENKAAVELSLLENVKLTSTPEYHASVTALGGICANSASKFINMSEGAKVLLAIQVGKMFIENIKNEIDK